MALLRPNRWAQLENCVGGLFLVLLLVTPLMQACARFLGISIPITEEFGRYQLFTLAFLAMSGAIITDSHQSMDVLRFFVDPSTHRLVRLVIYLLMAFLLAVLLWLGVEFLVAQIASGRQWFSAPIPQWIAYVCYPVGCALGLFRLIEKIIYQLRHRGEG